jgi:NADH:ubiquinone reductase (H+-translocating)
MEGKPRRFSRFLVVAGGAALLGALGVLGVRVRRRTLARRVETERGGLPRVVVIGGGAAGLFCSLGLKDAPVETVVIDRVNHYLYEALIYQLATGQLDEDDVSLPLREELRRAPNTTVLMAEVLGIDLERHMVHLRDHPHTVFYDYLVMATGLEPNYFGHEEWARYAPPLKTLADAVDLRDRILSTFEEAERIGDSGRHPELNTIVLVGGGPTGVEMAGALSEMLRATPREGYKRFDPASVRIVLIEAASRLLPGFSEETAAKVRGKLESMGVEIRLGHAVESIDAEGVVAEGERIASRTIVWTAGMHATPLARATGLPTDSSGRVYVAPDLTAAEHPEVYVIGDAAHVEQDGELLPALAPVALEEARYAARSITRAVAGRTPSRPFRYFDRGEAATVGRGYGAVEALGGRVKLTGVLAKIVWVAAHLFFQVPAGDKTRMLSKWTWASLTPRLRSRVITGDESVTLETHDESVAQRPAGETVTRATH